MAPIVAVLLLVAGDARANGDGALGEHFNEVVVGGGVVLDAAGTAGRGDNGPQSQATLSVTLPAGAEVEMARLYLGTIGTVDQNAITLTFDGTEVVASLIGTDGPTCWPDQLNATNINRSYRADVTDSVAGSGSFTVVGFPSSVSLNDDSQGLGLLVVYRDDSSESATQVVVNDGALTNVDPQDVFSLAMSNTLTGLTVPDDFTGAELLNLVVDAQENDDSLLFEDEHVEAYNAFRAEAEFIHGRVDDVTALLSPGSTEATSEILTPDTADSWDCLGWAVHGLAITFPNHGGSGGTGAAGGGGTGQGGGVDEWPTDYGVERENGCDCRTSRGGGTSLPWLAWIAVGATWARLRRRRSAPR